MKEMTVPPMLITIGDVRLEINAPGLAPDARTALLAAYADFLTADPQGAKAAPDLKIALAAEDGPPFCLPVTGEDSWRITTRQDGARLIFHTYCERGWLDLAEGSASLLLRPAGRIENFLRLATARLALARGGLLLHASGVIVDGGGYAFFGHSGAGKSTVASLAPPGSTVLSDDLVLLWPQSGGLVLQGVPFYGEALNAPRANAAAPLRGLYALEQARRHAIGPLPPAVATACLLAAVPFVAGDPNAMHAALMVCTKLVKTTPIRKLSFGLDGGFWPLLKEA